MPEPIIRVREGDFVIHGKNDGTDYWRLVRACIDENLDQEALRRSFPGLADIVVRRNGVEARLTPLRLENPKRMVFRMEAGGRRFILKRARMGSIGLRRLFPRALGTTYFTRVMKMVDAAVAAGCRSTQDCFLVAEKWLSPLRQEVWVLFEYVEGVPLSDHPDPASRTDALERAVEDLLRHDLTLDDLSPGNFIDDGEAIRAIDISCRPFTRLQRAKMRLKMRRRHGLRLSSGGAFEGLLEGMLAIRYRLRGALGGGEA